MLRLLGGHLNHYNDIYQFNASIMTTIQSSNVSGLVNESRPIVVSNIEEVLTNVYFNVFFMGCLAALVSILLTLFIEFMGPVIGGIFASIPTAIVPSTLGFAFSTMMSSTAHESFDMQQKIMVKSFFAVPIGNFMTLFFLLSWKYVPKHLFRWVIQPFRNLLSRKIKKLMEIELILLNSTLEISSGIPNLENEKEYYTLDQQDVLLDKKIQKKLRNVRMKQKIYRFFESKGFIRVFSACLVMLVSMTVLLTLSGIYLGISELSHWPDAVTIVLGSLCLVGNVLIGLSVNWKCSKFKSSSLKAAKIPLKQRICNCSANKIILLILKIIVPFTVVSITVYLKKISLTTIAGLLASFPAIYGTTLFTLWLGNEDHNLSIEAAGPMGLGSSSISLYAMISCPMIMYWNIFGGAAIGYIVAVSSINVPAYFYLRWRSRVEEQKELLEMERMKVKEVIALRCDEAVSEEEKTNQVDYNLIN